MLEGGVSSLLPAMQHILDGALLDPGGQVHRRFPVLQYIGTEHGPSGNRLM